MKSQTKKTVWRRLAACLAAAGFALASSVGAAADGGNAITGKTLFGDVDGSATTVSDVLKNETDPQFTGWLTTADPIKIGRGSVAKGERTIAIGVDEQGVGNSETRAEGERAIAIGSGALAQGMNAVAVGGWACGAYSAAILGSAGDSYDSAPYASAINGYAAGPFATSIGTWLGADGMTTDAAPQEKTRYEEKKPLLAFGVHNSMENVVFDIYTNATVKAAADNDHAVNRFWAETKTLPQVVRESETDPTFSDWANGTSIVAGQGASVSNPVAVAIGYNSFARGTNAVAVGVDNYAYGIGSVAFGAYNQVCSDYNSAIGYHNKAGINDTYSQMYCNSFGYYNVSQARHSSAFGDRNEAYSGGSSAFGRFNRAYGACSSAFGYSTKTYGACSSAFGYGAQANGDYSVAIGDATPGEPIVYEVWTNNVPVVLDDGSVSNSVVVITNESATAVGYANAAGIHSLALGYMAYAPAYSVGMAYSPDRFYLCSSNTSENAGATARTLQSYLDERATRYTFAAPTDAAIAAADGKMYSVSADTNGVSVTLPAAATYSQDFVVRLAPTDTNGTCLAEVKASDGTEWQYDYPTGTNAVFGTITAPTYFTFTQTAADRWSVITYAATKDE